VTTSTPVSARFTVARLERAKKVLSVADHNHYKRLNHQTKHNDVELAKSNILSRNVHEFRVARR
jgi:ATP-dependent protease Clp ATPase subunit